MSKIVYNESDSVLIRSVLKIGLKSLKKKNALNSFEDLQKLDWAAERQTNADDFADRATAATERVFHARQQLLQAVFAQ